jgi:hypothetical protein
MSIKSYPYYVHRRKRRKKWRNLKFCLRYCCYGKLNKLSPACGSCIADSYQLLFHDPYHVDTLVIEYCLAFFYVFDDLLSTGNIEVNIRLFKTVKMKCNHWGTNFRQQSVVPSFKIIYSVASYLR